MRQEIFNPDIINEEPSQQAPETDKTEKTQLKKRSGIKNIYSLIVNGSFRIFLGILTCLVSLYLFISFISFFSNGAADQSRIKIMSSVELAENGETAIQNTGGTLGASISNSIINDGIGVSAFIFATWLFLIGLGFAKIRKTNYFNITLVSTLLIAIVSLAFGLSSLYYEFFFNLGGNYGKYISAFLIRWVGTPGTVIIYLLLIFALILIWYQSIMAAVRKAKSLIPHVNVVNENKKTKEDEQTKGKFQNIETEQEKVEPPIEKEVETEITPISIGELPKENVHTKEIIKEVPKNDENDIPMTIKVGTIEKAVNKEISKDTFDPTLELSKYKFPPLDLLRKIEIKEKSVDIKEQEDNKKRITETLNNYGIPIKNIEVCVGPTVTLFEIIPADGVRISKIKNLEDDIALSLSALGIRIIAPIPGRGTIGIEVPNREPQTVSMRSIIESKKYQECKYELPMALGCTISNQVYIADLCKMPHILVAGATGQGKSVGLNAIITSLIYRKHPAELKFVLIDPKMVEFSLYSKLEHHYLAKLPEEEDAIITDSSKVIATLNSLAVEMENRYTLLKNAQVRNVKEYNAKFINRILNPEKGHKFLPYIVVVVDEFADLIMTAGKEIELPIARIAQKARAVGIHMIIATQRPSTDVITGMIKANFPGRIAFRVTQMVDSRTILDCTGAQQLIGRGDMLFLANGEMERVQCAFIDTPEVEAICDYIDNQIGYEEAYTLPEYIETNDKDKSGVGSIADRDPLFEEAAAFIVSGQTASTSSLQRRYAIGYNRAGKIMDQMQSAGIVGPSQGGKPRQVLVDSIQLTQILNN